LEELYNQDISRSTRLVYFEINTGKRCCKLGCANKLLETVDGIITVNEKNENNANEKSRNFN
jgi:hypothetical protein